MEARSAGVPAILMIVSGVLGLVYAIGFFLWTLVPLAWGTVVVAVNVSEKGSDELLFGLAAFFATPALQCAVYAVCTITAFLTTVAGVRFNQYRSYGLCWLGVICSIATPLLGFLGTSASLFNCGAVGAGLLGCLFGNAGTLPLLVVGGIASLMGAVTLSNPAYAARFQPEG